MENENGTRTNVILIAIIIVLLLVIIGILGYFLIINKQDEKQMNNTTTTTTTTEVTTTTEAKEIKMPKDLEEYKTLLNSATNSGTFRHSIALLDDTFKEFKEPFCDKVGTKTEIVDGHDVSVKCTEMDEDFVDLNSTYTVDNKFKFTIKGNRTCGSDYMYIGENFMISYDVSCFKGGENLVIYNSSGGNSYKAGKAAPYIKTYDKTTDDPDDLVYRPFIKNNNLYFVGAKDEGNDNKSTCSIYRLDLSGKSISFVTSKPFDCEFSVME